MPSSSSLSLSLSSLTFSLLSLSLSRRKASRVRPSLRHSTRTRPAGRATPIPPRSAAPHAARPHLRRAPRSCTGTGEPARKGPSRPTPRPAAPVMLTVAVVCTLRAPAPSPPPAAARPPHPPRPHHTRIHQGRTAKPPRPAAPLPVRLVSVHGQKKQGTARFQRHEPCEAPPPRRPRPAASALRPCARPQPPSSSLTGTGTRTAGRPAGRAPPPPPCRRRRRRRRTGS